MDREEYPQTVDVGEGVSVACIPEVPIREPALSDAGAATCPDEDARVLSGEQDLSQSPTEAGGNQPSDRITPAQIVEALLFSSDAPLSAARLAQLSGIKLVGEVRRRVAELNEKYTQAGLSFRIEEIARGYQMLSLACFRPWLAELNKHHARSRLSAAALETLSIVAYKQPVIRADIEAIRGVGSGEVLNRLREIGLVKIMGRAEVVGRPMLYGTTRKFLDIFGLADLEDLPPMESLILRRPVAAEVAELADEQPDGDSLPREVPVVVAGA